MTVSPNFQLPRVATQDDPLRLAIFISGSGSGMDALINYQKRNKCAHITTLVLSNNNDAAGILKAEKHGIKTEVVSLISGMERKTHEEIIHEKLIANGVEAVILSGYMRILSNAFVNKWEGRLLNIHPSLLPNFPGAHAHRDALNADATKSGCTVHFVDNGVDSGLIIAQSETKIFSGETVESLQEKIKKLEHVLYPTVIDAFSEGRLEIDGANKVIIK